jgi:hypothetical protein
MTLRRRTSLALLAVLPGVLCASPAPAQTGVSRPPAEVDGVWPQARLVGSSTLRFMGLRIYDARLWSPVSVTPQNWRSQPLALELIYARSLKGEAIASRSLDEMRRQGPIDAPVGDRWLALMQAAFPDVRDGDRLTGLQQPGAPAQLYVNGRPRASWTDAAFVQRFFGIWLDDATSEPALREALFGGRG